MNGSCVQVPSAHRSTFMTHWKDALKNRKLSGHGKKFETGMLLDQQIPCLAPSIWYSNWSSAANTSFCRYTSGMKEKAIDHSLHLFVHATNAEGYDIFQTVNSVCEKVGAEVLVMSAVHQVCTSFRCRPVHDDHGLQ